MSLINKMLKDLEKRGVTPSMAFGNTKEATQESITDHTAASEGNTETEAKTADTGKKQPSRLLIYSGLFLLIYLAFYGWVTFKGDQAFKQVANPLQAQQYQPKAVQPLHQTASRAPQTSTAIAATDTTSDVASEIKAAIEAEIKQVHAAANDAEIEKMLSEAEAARQAAIEKALAGEVATNNSIAKTAPAKPVKKTIAKRETVRTTKPTPKVAKIAVKPKSKKKTTVVKKPVKVAKASAKVVQKSAHKASKPLLAKAPAKLSAAKPHANTRAKTAAPKIVKTVRLEHQAEALYQKALTYVQQGRVSEAQTVLANALDIDPAHQDARQTLAALLLDNQRIQAAKNVLQDGLVVTPNHLPFRMAVARLEVELGQSTLALETLMQGKKQALNHAEYQAFMGTLLQGQNRHAEAITHFQNALNINRGLSNVLIGMGVSYQALNRLDDAKIAYQKAQSNTRLPNNLKDFLDYRIKEVEQRISSK